MAEVNMSKAEANWIADRMMETVVLVANRTLETGPASEKEKKHLLYMRKKAAENLSIVDYDENGDVIPRPELVDVTQVPRHNLELLLKDPLKFRYFSVNFAPWGSFRAITINPEDLLNYGSYDGLTDGIMTSDEVGEILPPEK